MLFTTDGLVLRVTETGEHDRLLVLLTPENGQVTVMVKGARSSKSQLAALTQPFVYGNFELYHKGDMNWLRGGSVTEYFAGVHEDMIKLSLAAYIAEVAREITGEYVSGVDILRMTLNALYALSRGSVEPRLIKATYEWRAAGFSGYMPEMSHCRSCRREPTDTVYLDVMNGGIICADCLKRQSAVAGKEACTAYDDTQYSNNLLIPMGLGAVAAAGFVLHALPERVYSFRIKDAQDIGDFCRAGEAYLLNHLECGFYSLDFYKTMIK